MAAVLVTTHYMDEADELCDRIALMHAGRIEAVGTPGATQGAPLPRMRASMTCSSKLTGATIETGGGYRDVRQARLGASEHS